MAQEVLVVEGTQGLGHATTAAVPATAKRRGGGRATDRPNPVRRTAFPGADVGAATPALELAGPSVLVVPASRTPLTSGTTAFRAANVEETAATTVLEGA